MPRSTSLNRTTDVAITREIDSKYDKVKTVADSISNVEAVSGSITNVNLVGSDISAVTPVGQNIDSVVTVSDSVNNVNAVANNATNINLVGNDITNVNNVGGSIDNVDRVSASIDNVNTLIGHTDEIDRVATSADAVDRVNTSIDNLDRVFTSVDNIDRVSTSADNVDRVSTSADNLDRIFTSIDNIDTVEGDLTNIDRVATSADNLDRVFTSIDNVDAVYGDITNVDTVADSISNVNAVGTDIANVNTAATDIANVNTVATNIAAVNAVADANNLADVIRVADDLNSLDVNGIADITTVANDLVQGVDSDIITVSENITDITTVAGNLTSINNLLLVTDDITTLAPVADDIDALGPVAEDITTVADNLTSINGFSQKYIISDTAPIDNTEGRLWYDSVNDIVKVWNGTGWQETSKAVEATHNRYSYVATAGQQVFNATYNAGYVDVFYNGMKLQDGVDYTATSSTYIQLVSAANAGDIVDIIGYAVVSVLDEVFSAPTTTSIQFNGGTGSQGTVVWNTEEETLDLDQGGATLQLGQEIQISCQNNTASAIPDGTVVMATGSSGVSGKINIAPYDGVSDIHYVLGITTEEIAASDIGKVTSYGKVRKLDTTAFAAGDVLYTTAGGALTNVKPTSGIINPIAFVLASHANNGSIMVRFTPVDDNQYYTKTEVDTEVAVANGNALAFAIALG